MKPKKPKIALDTKKPLIVLGGYELDESGGIIHTTVDLNSKEDYGADPLGDGTFRMVPSGDIVDSDERNRRLARFRK